jgi:hypothetical protein
MVGWPRDRATAKLHVRAFDRRMVEGLESLLGETRRALPAWGTSFARAGDPRNRARSKNNIRKIKENYNLSLGLRGPVSPVRDHQNFCLNY